jgi:hypothetical protein
MRPDRLLTLAAVATVTAGLFGGGGAAVAAEPGSVAISSLPFAGTVSGPTADTPGGTGTTAGNAAVVAQCNNGSPLRDAQWFALPAGDGSSVYARTSGLQYGRIAAPVPVAVALVDRDTGAVLRCASGSGSAQAAPLETSPTGHVDVVAYFPQPYQDVSDGLPDTLRLLVDRTTGRPPANDSAETATPITTLPVHETVDTSLSRDDSAAFQGCHWIARHTAWWSYQPTTSGTLHLSASADLPAPKGDGWPGASLAVARVTDAGRVQVLPDPDSQDCVTPVSSGDLAVQPGERYLIGVFVAEDPSEASLAVGGRLTLDVEQVAPQAPGAATQATVKTNVRARTATIRWAPPVNDGGSPVTGYRVTLTRVHGGKVKARTTVLPAAARTATVRHLQRGRTYRLTVRAVNAVGAGPATGGTVLIPRHRGHR